MPVPVNTAPPVISGSQTVGNRLSCTTGTWTNSPTSYSYQWQIIGTPTTNISGAISSTYVTTNAEVGLAVDCQVTATNGSGNSAPQVSSDSIIVTAPLSLADTICIYLQSAGLSLNFNGAGTVNCFSNFLNDTPDQIVAVFERAGMVPLMMLAGGGAGIGVLDQPQFQVRVRSASGDYAGGNALTQNVYGVLQGVTETYLPDNGGQLFHLVTALGSPGYLGIDVRQRHEWSQTFRVLYEDEQRA